jgi:fimbrial isopeptide formation D2 family protein/LPXTG-motif cell wall-anchored protein
MKKMKKLLSMLLAVVMVLAMAAPSFAGTITIDNPTKDENGKLYNYRAYKIFDVTYDEEQTTYAYSIEATSNWFLIVSSYDNVVVVDNPDPQKPPIIPNGTEIVLTKVASENRYAATFPETNNKANLNAAEFAKYLKGKLNALPETTEVINFTGDENSATAEVGLGYYFVTSDADTNALCNLTTTDPDATIHDKNDVPFDKADDKEDVEVGEQVNYILTGKVPDTTGFESYDYIITDTMSEGLTFNNDIVVYFAKKVEKSWEDNAKPDNIEVVKNGETIEYFERISEMSKEFYTIDTTPVDPEKFTFKLTINVMELKDKITTPLLVKYSAKVNEKAVSVISTNKAELSFSNDPTNKDSYGTREDEETVYSAKVAIDKYAKNDADANDKTLKLADAEFVLKNSEGHFYKYIKVGDALADGTTATENDVTWVTNQADATVMKTADGTEEGIEKGYAEFPGLKNGTYKLVEIKAPNGYNLLDQEIDIVINNENATADNYYTLSQSVMNVAGTKLPSTGGIGTTIFYAAGIILMAGAVFFVVRRKRA